MRVKAGVRVLSRTYPETTKLLTAFLASEFPGDSFLTIQVQVDVDKPPHKDVRNTPMPTLLVNLSEGAPGGTWVEAPDGKEVIRCPDGVSRRGTTLRGHRYRLQARTLWHASVLDGSPRVLLLGWVPAGWNKLNAEDIDALCCLGFVPPPLVNSPPAAIGGLQRSLQEYGFHPGPCRSPPRTGYWNAHQLKHTSGPLHICLSSDDSTGGASSHRDSDVVCVLDED